MCKALILNRPRHYHSLDSMTLDHLTSLVLKYERHEHATGSLLLRGSGDSFFCSGTDFVEVLGWLESGQAERAAEQASTLCELSYALATHSHGTVAFLNGRALGSGAGLATQALVRICTEHSGFALPQPQIGWFPDAGVLYRLARLTRPGLARMLALTGRGLRASDLLHAGLATHYMRQADFDLLHETLCQHAHTFGGPEGGLRPDAPRHELLVALGLFDAPRPTFSLRHDADEIERAFAGAASLPELVELLREREARLPWARESLRRLLSASPLALRVTWRLLHAAAKRPLHEVLLLENRVARRLLLRPPAESDLVHGVRHRVVRRRVSAIAWPSGHLEDEALPEGRARVAEELDELFSRLPDPAHELLLTPARVPDIMPDLRRWRPLQKLIFAEPDSPDEEASQHAPARPVARGQKQQQQAQKRKRKQGQEQQEESGENQDVFDFGAWVDEALRRDPMKEPIIRRDDTSHERIVARVDAHLIPDRVLY